MSHVCLRGFRLPVPLCWRLGDAAVGAGKGLLDVHHPPTVATPAQDTSLLARRVVAGAWPEGCLRARGRSLVWELWATGSRKGKFPLCFDFHIS